MAFGMRKPSINRMIGAQKAKLTKKAKSALPLYNKKHGFYTKPSKKIYNNAYKRTTFSLIDWLLK